MWGKSGAKEIRDKKPMKKMLVRRKRVKKEDEGILKKEGPILP